MNVDRLAREPTFGRRDIGILAVNRSKSLTPLFDAPIMVAGIFSRAPKAPGILLPMATQAGACAAKLW